MSRDKEGVIESYLCKRIKALGGEAWKMVIMNDKGSPDRWCFLPGGLLIIIETKYVTGRTSGKQKLKMKKLKRLGFNVAVASTIEEVDSVLEKYA